MGKFAGVLRTSRRCVFLSFASLIFGYFPKMNERRSHSYFARNPASTSISFPFESFSLDLAPARPTNTHPRLSLFLSLTISPPKRRHTTKERLGRLKASKHLPSVSSLLHLATVTTILFSVGREEKKNCRILRRVGQEETRGLAFHLPRRSIIIRATRERLSGQVCRSPVVTERG